MFLHISQMHVVGGRLIECNSPVIMSLCHNAYELTMNIGVAELFLNKKYNV